MTYDGNKSTGTLLFVEHLDKNSPSMWNDNSITAYIQIIYQKCKNRHNMYLINAKKVLEADTIQKMISIYLYHIYSFVCLILLPQDNWFEFKFSFKILKRLFKLASQEEGMTFDSMIQNLSILHHKRIKLGHFSNFYHLFPTAHMPSNDSI